MPSFLKGLKDKLRDKFDLETLPRRGEQKRNRSRSLPIRRSRMRDGFKGARSLSRDLKDALTISEPHIGPTRKDRAKDDEWDHIYDDPQRRHTDTSCTTTHREWTLPGGYTIQFQHTKSQKGSPRGSRDHILEGNPRHPKEHRFLSPRGSRDHVSIYDPERSRDLFASSRSLRNHVQGKKHPKQSGDHVKRDPRRSRGHHSQSREQSRGRETSLRQSAEHRRRRRRKSSHPKELSRHRSHYCSSNTRVNEGNIPPIPSITPIPQTQNIFVVNKQGNDRSEKERKKEGEQSEADKKRLRLDRENQRRYAKEYNERQKGMVAEQAAKTAASQARQQMEEETARKRRERVGGEWEDTKREERKGAEQEQKRDRQMYLQARPQPKRTGTTPAPLTTANLKAAGKGVDDSADSDAKSELNRPFGDPTRTYLEGMVPAKEIEEVQRRKREGARWQGAPSQLNRQLGDMRRTYLEGMVPETEVRGRRRR